MHRTSHHHLGFGVKFILQNIGQLLNGIQHHVPGLCLEPGNGNGSVVIRERDASLLGIHHAHAYIFH